MVLSIIAYSLSASLAKALDNLSQTPRLAQRLERIPFNLHFIAKCVQVIYEHSRHLTSTKSLIHHGYLIGICSKKMLNNYSS